jgi:ATP-dependent exoDNAse (exonuclease V) alpha subunit
MGFGTTSSSERQPQQGNSPARVAPQKAARPARGKMVKHWDTWQVRQASLGLTPSQQRFTEAFFRGESCLLTGEAGTGKSFTINAMVSFLLEQKINVAVTGSTGVAALNIGGQTLHSFCGIGLGEDPLEQLISNVMKNKKAKERIRAIDVLFLDEASMVKGELLDKVSGLFKSIRHCYDPFGGVQVVLIGDFLQLLPVFKGYSGDKELAFQSAAWREADIQTIILKEQMRQKSDNTFARVLGDLRFGDANSLHLLDSRIDATFPNDGIEPVRIFCKNADVDSYNRKRLAQITAPSKVFRAKDTGLPQHTDAFNRNCPAPQVLELKPGALVTLLTNEDVTRGFVNGSVGVVKAFTGQGVKVQFLKGELVVGPAEWHMKDQEVGVDGKMKSKIIATRSQIPLKLAWGATTHRIQGQTLDRAIVDMSESFGYAMCYVALSRVRDMDSFSIMGEIPKSAIRAHPACVQFYRDAERA